MKRIKRLAPWGAIVPLQAVHDSFESKDQTHPL